MPADVTAYRWCELTLGSDIELPELPRAQASGLDPHWRIQLDEGRAPRRPGRHWFHHWRLSDGRRWLSLARHAGGYLLRFPSLADFEVRAGGREIHCYRLSRTPLRTLRHLLLDQVLPLTIGGHDRLALHASVVSIEGGAVAFLGLAGHGKSTLAATLTRHGCALVSDDCCVLRRRRSGDFEVVPSYPGARLWPASIAHLFGVAGASYDRVSHYSSKRRVRPSEIGVSFSSAPVRLRRLYILAPRADLERATRVSIRPKPAREALLDTIAFTFHLDVRHGPRVLETFDLAVDVARTCGVRLLTFPWDLRRVESVAEAVLEDL